MWLPLECPLPGTWPATQTCALTGNRTGDPLVGRPVLNTLSYTSQGMWFNLISSYYHLSCRRFSILLLPSVSITEMASGLLIRPDSTSAHTFFIVQPLELEATAHRGDRYPVILLMGEVMLPWIISSVPWLITTLGSLFW